MLFKILTLSALAIFYSVYLGKMIAQSRRGIQTDQLAKCNKPKRVFFTELSAKIFAYAAIAAQIMSVLFTSSTSNIFVQCFALILFVSAIAVFSSAVYTMHDSWRAGLPEKKTSLVTSGIYSRSRNPAFLGFDLLNIGVLLMFFNLPLMVISLGSMISYHMQILQEEKYLAATFGEEYTQYKHKVRRYFGRR